MSQQLELVLETWNKDLYIVLKAGQVWLIACVCVTFENGRTAHLPYMLK